MQATNVGISQDYGPDYYQGMDSAPPEGLTRITLKGAEKQGTRQEQAGVSFRQSVMPETL